MQMSVFLRQTIKNFIILVLLELDSVCKSNSSDNFIRTVRLFKSYS